jgi:hypothetical protein
VKVIASEFIDQLCKAVGVRPEETRRIILDVQVHAPIRVYVEGIGTDRLLNFNPVGLSDAEIEVVKA